MNNQLLTLFKERAILVQQLLDGEDVANDLDWIDEEIHELGGIAHNMYIENGEVKIYQAELPVVPENEEDMVEGIWYIVPPPEEQGVILRIFVYEGGDVEDG